MSRLGTFTPDNLLAGENPPLTTQHVVVVSGQDLVRGQVLALRKIGAVPSTGTAVGTVNDASVTTVTGGPKTKPGVYTLTCISTGTNLMQFLVTNPEGQAIGVAGIGAFEHPEINFTVVDGGDEAVLGSGFTITVPAGDGKVAGYDSEAVGLGEPYGVLAMDVDATDGDGAAGAYERGIFNENALVFANGDDDADDVRDAFRVLGISLKVNDPAPALQPTS
jgi:hypothetical protein